jgi:hypothetical protein
MQQMVLSTVQCLSLTAAHQLEAITSTTADTSQLRVLLLDHSDQSTLNSTGLCITKTSTNFKLLNWLSIQTSSKRSATAVTNSTLLVISQLLQLRVLELSGCRNITRLPDVTGLTALQYIDLRYCKKLTELQGLNSLIALQVLLLAGCTSLQRLAPMNRPVALQRLDCSYCSKLDAVPHIGAAKSLHYLNLQGCPLLTSIQDLRSLRALQYLNVKDCSVIKHTQQYSNVIELQQRAGFEYIDKNGDTYKTPCA